MELFQDFITELNDDYRMNLQLPIQEIFTVLPQKIQEMFDQKLLFVLFEKELYCDPLTDHECPKNVNNLYNKQYQKIIQHCQGLCSYVIKKFYFSYIESITSFLEVQSEFYQQEVIGQIILILQDQSASANILDNLKTLNSQQKKNENLFKSEIYKLKEQILSKNKIGDMYNADNFNRDFSIEVQDSSIKQKQLTPNLELQSNYKQLLVLNNQLKDTNQLLVNSVFNYKQSIKELESKVDSLNQIQSLQQQMENDNNIIIQQLQNVKLFAQSVDVSYNDIIQGTVQQKQVANISIQTQPINNLIKFKSSSSQSNRSSPIDVILTNQSIQTISISTSVNNQTQFQQQICSKCSNLISEVQQIDIIKNRKVKFHSKEVKFNNDKQQQQLEDINSIQQQGGSKIITQEAQLTAKLVKGISEQYLQDLTDNTDLQLIQQAILQAQKQQNTTDIGIQCQYIDSRLCSQQLLQRVQINNNSRVMNPKDIGNCVINQQHTDLNIQQQISVDDNNIQELPDFNINVSNSQSINSQQKNITSPLKHVETIQKLGYQSLQDQLPSNNQVNQNLQQNILASNQIQTMLQANETNVNNNHQTLNTVIQQEIVGTSNINNCISAINSQGLSDSNLVDSYNRIYQHENIQDQINCNLFQPGESQQQFLDNKNTSLTYLNQDPNINSQENMLKNTILLNQGQSEHKSTNIISQNTNTTVLRQNDLTSNSGQEQQNLMSKHENSQLNSKSGVNAAIQDYNKFNQKQLQQENKNKISDRVYQNKQNDSIASKTKDLFLDQQNLLQQNITQNIVKGPSQYQNIKNNPQKTQNSMNGKQSVIDNEHIINKQDIQNLEQQQQIDIEKSLFLTETQLQNDQFASSTIKSSNVLKNNSQFQGFVDNIDQQQDEKAKNERILQVQNQYLSKISCFVPEKSTKLLTLQDPFKNLKTHIEKMMRNRINRQENWKKYEKDIRNKLFKFSSNNSVITQVSNQIDKFQEIRLKVGQSWLQQLELYIKVTVINLNDIVIIQEQEITQNHSFQVMNQRLQFQFKKSQNQLLLKAPELTPGTQNQVLMNVSIISQSDSLQKSILQFTEDQKANKKQK
ncbi:hypothetical protein SS50377_25519 [Spironucleus salmonicida]|uniref:Uncharacterized protein n=1 Tax=Spironucleus salmonicida TaxID=348837 RepID=V6LKH3_9EUKA|nr:hypothetical protein SS50377_25519 [Spironucleus salmonicida]|eukprot:EST45067.1 hypothetical protein SS50377_15087 [Spironucleus salmonicida]